MKSKISLITGLIAAAFIASIVITREDFPHQDEPTAIEPDVAPPSSQTYSPTAPDAPKPDAVTVGRTFTTTSVRERVSPPALGVPHALDLGRLAPPQSKNRDRPTLTIPQSPSLERLFEQEAGEEVRISFGDTLSFVGEILWIMPQPGTTVRALAASNEVSTLHLEESRRGSYRGSIIHKRSRIAHRLTTQEDGSLLIEQIPFSETICTAEGSTPENAAGLPRFFPDSVPAENAFPEPADPPILDSRPSATAVIYLDFDGQTVTGTSWNTDFGVATINAAPSILSTSQMEAAWKQVAEDFAAFNISVTTNVTRYNSAPQNRRIRVISTPTSSWCGPYGGIAYLQSFRWTGDTPCWVFEYSGYSGSTVAAAASHEVGHTLNLKHDGKLPADSTTSPTGEYYHGVNTSLASWGPIMGTGYTQTFTQWSKGEYLGATNSEDDLAIIASTTNGFGYRTDDKGDTLTTALSLALQPGSQTLVEDRGVIEKNNDVDLMRFSAGAGTLSLQVSPATPRPNLFLSADLLNSTGSVVLSRTATKNATSLNISQTLAAGTYYLRIRGVGMPAPSGSPPYSYDTSGYGSLGEYFVSGSIPQPTAPASLSVTPLSITQSSSQGVNAGSQTFTVRNAGGSTMNYNVGESLSWLSVSPSSGSSSGEEITHTILYSTSGLSPGTYSGTITVSASGAGGSPASVNVSLTVSPTGSALTFSNSSAISIPSSGTSGSATPYPSQISVSGVPPNLASVSVGLNGVQHSFASDLDILLVAPNGQSVLLLSDAGGDQPFAGGTVNLVFRDDASLAPEFSQLAGGSYRPTNYGDNDVLASPAPAGPYGTALSPLLAGSVNGAWSLYVFDDYASADGGQIANGWSLSFVVSAGPSAPTGVSATDGTFTDKVRVTWAPVTGATSYEVHRSEVNDSTFAALIGTTASTTFDDTVAASGITYYYWVKTVNAGGASTFSASNSGFRGVPATINDNFSNRTTLSGNSASVSASNTSATKESGEPNHGGNAGGRSLWWNWTAPQTGTLTVDTIGSSFDTTLGVYTGGSVAALTTRASDDDSGGGVASRVVLQVASGTSYAIAVDGFDGATGTVLLNLSFSASVQPPSPPTSMSASDGAFTDRVRIAWTSGAGAETYDVHRNTSAVIASSSLIGNTGGLVFDDLSAVAGTTYHYWVVSRNSAGTSSPAGPDAGYRTNATSNDNFADRTLLSGASVTTVGNSANATKEIGEPNHGGNAGGKSLWWAWTAPQNGTLTVDTIGSGFDTTLGIYTGTNLGALTVLASDDDSGGDLASRAIIGVTSGTNYKIAVDGFNGASGNVTLNLVFQSTSQPPTAPSSVTATDALFSDRIGLTWGTGGGATSYDVHRGTSNVFGSSTLLTNVSGTSFDDFSPSPGVTYYYWVVSRNPAGVSSPAGPDTGVRSITTPNYTFASRVSLVGSSGSVTANNTMASKEPGEPNHAGNGGGRSLWWSWTSPAAGTLTVDTVGSGFDTLLAVYTGSNITSLTHVASNDDFGGGFNRTSRVTFGTVAGTTYHIAVDGFRGASGEVVLNFTFDNTPFATNDLFSNRIPLFGSALTVSGNNLTATREPGEPNHGGTNNGKSLWWSWTAPGSGTLVIDTFGSEFNTTLGVYSGTSIVSLGALALNDDAAIGGTSLVSLAVGSGAVYQIALDGYDGASGNFVLNLRFTPFAQAAEPNPVSPSRVRASRSGTNRIRLRWSPGANATGYLVEIRSSGSTRWRRVKVVQGASLSLTVSKLTQKGVYQFRVTALRGGAKASRPSRSIRFRL